MTRDEHIKAHVDLHRSLSLLVAEWITHNPDKRLSTLPTMELMRWAHEQTIEPTLLRSTKYDEDLGEGDDYPVPGCTGKIGLQPVENCSCHISPPCSACVDNPLVCLSCGWLLGDPTK